MAKQGETEMNTQQPKDSMLKRAIGLGFIGIFSYIANYYLRNLLSVATPSMLESGEYTAEFIGLLSSVYFIVYASGQLVNGLVGDMVNPKYMISVGLTVTGTVIAIFPSLPFAWMQVACFALMGVGLSMLRGPIMKMVSENVNKDYSRVICTCLSAASFAGPLVASCFAIAFKWNIMFVVAGVTAIFIAVLYYTPFFLVCQYLFYLFLVYYFHNDYLRDPNGVAVCPASFDFAPPVHRRCHFSRSGISGGLHSGRHANNCRKSY